MHQNYSDITILTKAPPKWHDENGVPRYCDFHPDQIANIYASEAVLAVIECQRCQTEFRVAFSEINQRHKLWDQAQRQRISFLSDLISNRSLHYGDPPNTDCCDAGPSMNSVPVSVEEYWFKPFIKITQPGESISDPSMMNWVRDPNFEVSISKG